MLNLCQYLKRTDKISNCIRQNFIYTINYVYNSLLWQHLPSQLYLKPNNKTIKNATKRFPFPRDLLKLHSHHLWLINRFKVQKKTSFFFRTYISKGCISKNGTSLNKLSWLFRLIASLLIPETDKLKPEFS